MPDRRTELIAIILFLASIVTANFLILAFGPRMLPVTAFFLIPVDLVTRDILHERWHGNNLWLKTWGLVLMGGSLTILLNQDAWQIAIASMTAFGASVFTNAILYSILFEKRRAVKMNVSNLFAASVDSILFQMIAFGSIVPWIAMTQTATKFAGGLLWISIYVKIIERNNRSRKERGLRDRAGEGLRPAESDPVGEPGQGRVELQRGRRGKG